MMNAVPLAARDADEAAKVMESRFVIAHKQAAPEDAAVTPAKPGALARLESLDIYF